MIGVISEKDRRINLWHTISKEPLNDLEPGRLRDLGIYGGAQGIWVDPPRTEASDPNTFRTSDWDKPNCRAIDDGLMPALNAARTAFTCPRVNAMVSTPACRLSGDLSARDERFVV